ncbi:hypothetical protein ES705_38348 [subsurface metagenome]
MTELEQQKIRQKVFVEFNPNYLVAHNGIEPRDIASIEKIPKQSSGNVKEDIELYLDRLSKNNMDVVVVDLTHPEIRIPVVRVVIPKLISYSGSPIKESVLLDAIKAFGGRLAD